MDGGGISFSNYTSLNMDTWRWIIAVIFVLVWYFSEFGQLWTQAFFCLVCFFIFPFKKQERETSTQTDITEETTRQTKKGHQVSGGDEVDVARTEQSESQTTQYPNILRSLLQVFKCAYASLVQPWYTVPELGDSQPLHRALHKEFNLVVERIICKAKNFDLSATSVGCIRIVTQHLHNAKQSERSPMFSSRYEEMAVLRTYSEALVRNLFPEYLWEAKVFHCALTEIVATKGLDVLVTFLCNPDNLNQMVVLKLDRVTLKSSIGELQNSDKEDASSSAGSEGPDVMTDEAEAGQSEETKEKKKGNRIKEKISKFVDKVKSRQGKKKKKQQNEVLQRVLSSRRAAVIEGDGVSSSEGSIRSQLESDDDSDTDVYLTSVQEDMMEFKLSYQMWRVGKWAVLVTNVQKENEELCFTVRLEERDNPENLHWDMKKTQSDILNFYSLLQDTTLPSISAIVEKSNRELDATYIEEMRSALERFLEELVSDPQLGHTQSVFQFLCPLAKLLSEEECNRGVWGLLSGLACFLTPAQDEEESHNTKGEEKVDESGATRQPAGLNIAQPACIDTAEVADSGIVEDPKPASFRCCTPHENPFRCEDHDHEDSDDAEIVSDGQESLAESIDIFVNRSKLVPPTVHSTDASSSPVVHSDGSQTDLTDSFSSAQFVKLNKKEKLTHKKSGGLQKIKGKEKTGQSKEETTNQPQGQKKELNQTSWEQLEATKAIFDLLKEISGNSFVINIVDAILKPVMPLVKKKVNCFLKRMKPTEVQIASYIDDLREEIWPGENVSPRPPRDTDEKNETKERALQLISSQYSNSIILKKTDVETVFKIFQDTEENKKLVYMLLTYVLKEFLPGEPAFSSSTNLTLKDLVS